MACIVNTERKMSAARLARGKKKCQEPVRQIYTAYDAESNPYKLNSYLAERRT